jgi:hypothetical protein
MRHENVPARGQWMAYRVVENEPHIALIDTEPESCASTFGAAQEKREGLSRTYRGAHNLDGALPPLPMKIVLLLVLHVRVVDTCSDLALALAVQPFRNLSCVLVNEGVQK